MANAGSGPRNKTNSPWTPEVLAEASRLWNEGLTAKQIHERMGGVFSRGALLDKAQKNRDLFPAKENQGRARKIVDFPLEEAARLWNDGKTSKEVAAALGVLPSFIRAKANSNRHLFVVKTSASKRVVKRTPQRAIVHPDIKRAVSQVQRMPLPTSGTWKPIELDDYELERLPQALSMNDNTGCKYPLTDTGPHLFCAHTRFQMKPYCAYHVVKCNPPGAGTQSERKAHNLKEVRR